MGTMMAFLFSPSVLNNGFSPHAQWSVRWHFLSIPKLQRYNRWSLEMDIKNNAWVTVNNDFWPRVRWFANDFHEWRSHEWKSLVRHSWKSLANHLTSDQKSLFTVTNVFISYALFYVFNTPFRYKQTSFAHFANVAKDCLFWLNIVTSSPLICDLTRTRGTSIVTSYSSIVLARANWRNGDLH